MTLRILLVMLLIAVAGLRPCEATSSYLYVSDRVTGQIYRIDAATRASTVLVSGLSSPAGLAIGHDRRLYAASDSCILRYNIRNGSLIDTFVPSGSGGLNGAEGVIFGSDGHLYVSSRSSDQVMRYHGIQGYPLPAPGKTGAVFAEGGGLAGPAGLAFGPDGCLYVASRGNHKVLRYNGKTGAFINEYTTLVLPGMDQGNPLDLAFGPDDSLYVSANDTIYNGVLRVDSKASEGYYNLNVAVTENGVQLTNAAVPFALLNKQDAYQGQDSPFGVMGHLGKWQHLYDGSDPHDQLFLYPDAGVSFNRIDYMWPDYVDVADQYGVKLLPILGTPSGTSADDPNADWDRRGISDDLSSYTQEVYDYVNAHKDKVKWWEIGNEPTYWYMLPEDYAQLLKAAYKGVKMADPGCTVIMGDMVFIADPVLRAKAGDFCDAIAIHPYGSLEVTDYWGVITRYMSLKQTMADCGVANKAIWVTETGALWTDGPQAFPGNTKAEILKYSAEEVVRKYTNLLALGAAKVFWYNFRGMPFNTLENDVGLVETDRLPRPAYVAYRTAAKMLAKASFAGAMYFADSNVRGFMFNNESGPIAVIWRMAGDTTVTLQMSSSYATVTGIMGNTRKIAASDGQITTTIGPSPIFVQGQINAGLDTAYGQVGTVTPYNFPAAIARIRPNPLMDARSCMGGWVWGEGTRVTVKIGQTQQVQARVYNLTDNDQQGSVTLTVPPQRGWSIVPAQVPIVIPANASKTVSFNVSVPSSQSEGSFYITVTANLNSGTFQGQCIADQKL